MGSIIGLGGWTPFYYYLLVTAAAKLIKDDFFFGDSNIIDSNIKNHKIISLFFGYFSEALFGLLIFIYCEYREYKRKMKKKSIQYENDKELKNKSIFDKINEILSDKKMNYPVSKKKSLKTNDEVNDSTVNEKKKNASMRNYSLIHNDLYQSVTENSFWYIILSCLLINIKEFVYKLIYSINNIFDYYFLNLFILTLILKFKYRQKIFKHQLLSLMIVIIISNICLLSCLFLDTSLNTEDGKEKKKLIIQVFNTLSVIFFILIYVISSLAFCAGIVLQKNLMDKKFVSPYKILLYKGVIGMLLSIIGLIISSNFKCPNDYLEKIKNMDNFDIFLCHNRYGKNYYYDHFILYFSECKNIAKEVILIIFYCIFHFFCEFSLILINIFLSPTHYLIAESLYSLIHLPVNFIANLSTQEIKHCFSDEGGDDSCITQIYNEIIQTPATQILKYISCFFDFTGYIIYLEIIELKFWGLNKNIRKNIEKRATIDGRLGQKELDDDSEQSEDSVDSEEGKEDKEGKENKGDKEEGKEEECEEEEGKGEV
jgi:hypothetical protein